MGPLALSVVTATYNRAEVLRTSLERLGEQTLPGDRFEVILVDDGSTDDTCEMVAAIQDRLPFALRFMQQPKNMGPGAAHNRGVREAEADIVLFLADDMHATPQVLEGHCRCHREHAEPHVAVVGKLCESTELPQTAFHKGWNPYKGKELDGKEELGEFDFWVSNLSMKRSFFLEHGVFKERRGPSHEDLELSYRLFKRGMRLIYCPEALAYHYHPQTIDDAVARAYAAGKAFRQYEEWVDHDKFHRYTHVLSPRLDRKTRLKYAIREIVRSPFFNRHTVPGIVLPLIRQAETNSLLEPFVGFLANRAVGHYFRAGVREGRKTGYAAPRENDGD